MVIFRVDASLRIGSGHVMRCLTLAEELRETGAEVRFITRPHEGNLNALIQKRGYKLYELSPGSQNDSTDSIRGEYGAWLGTSQDVDVSETIDVLKGFQSDWLIVDHYALDERWEKHVRPYAKKIMVIDDLADRKHDCDVLLDQNYVSGDQSRHMGLVPPSCTMLLGPKYALLRKEFAEARQRLKQRDGSVNRIFVFFGGVDSNNMTGTALGALSAPEFSHLDVDVVIGASNPHRDVIAEAVEKRARTRLHVQVENIAELMCSADLALCAGGSTTWERLCLGLPSLVVTIADNQVPFTRDLHMDGFLRWVGKAESIGVKDIRIAVIDSLRCPVRNQKQSISGIDLVKGNGTKCLVEFMLQGPTVNALILRKAVDADCKLFWYWANEPEVRASAFSSDPIPWVTHRSWFTRKLADSDSELYVVDSDTGPVGQVRFERKYDSYLISYSIGRQFRGFGLGYTVLDIAICKLAHSKEVNLIAEVKVENIASCRIFEKLGFAEYPGLRSGAKCYRMSLSNSNMKNT